MADFLCIGAQKAGTSWVHAQLERLPDICFPGGKEVHYWNLVQAGRIRGDLSWYRGHVRAPKAMLAGDMTPAYATLSEESVRSIAGEFPHLRVFMMLRNPIDRAWSAARMALVKAQLTMDEVDSHWFRLHFHSSASRQRSDYEATLRRWRNHYPENQVRHFLYEDIAARPGELIDRIYRFIGGREASASEALRGKLRQRVCAGLDEPLPGELWEALRDQYRPLILSLAAYLETSLDDWLRPPAHLDR